MMAFSKLPREVIQDIVSYLPNRCANRKDLLNSTRACRSFWDAATPSVYRDINLRYFHNQEKEVNKKSENRQLCLIKSIAENPKLGVEVRTFVNDSDWYSGGRDVTQRAETERSLLVEAANNMTGLRKASFSTNPLAIHVVTNLPSYPQLSDLTLDGFTPSKQIWKNSTTALKSLKLEIPTHTSTEGDSPLAEMRFLLRVLEATCPDLEVLDLIIGDPYSRVKANTDLQVAPDTIEAYNALPEFVDAKLTRFRHFGLTVRGSSNAEAFEQDVKRIIIDFVGKYGHQLKSLTIPGGASEWTREGLDFILKNCALVPNLRELNLSKGCLGPGSSLTAQKAFQELTTSPATAKLERFSTMDIQSHFSRDIGQLFRNWKNLKFLQGGDEDNTNGPFGGDGRPEFEEYRPYVLAFIKALPPSLEELYLEINGQELCCDDDETFDPLCSLSPEIFQALPHLHTCDIHAWISNWDSGLGSLPEKGVLYRRLPGDLTKPKEKTIWTSRMDFLYQDENILVNKRSEVVEDEAFEGEDAKEVWLDGATFLRKRLWTGRGREPDRPDWSWPFCADLIQSKIGDYEMWRARR